MLSQRVSVVAAALVAIMAVGASAQGNGGKPASYYDYPFQVAVREILQDNRLRHVCAGTLISCDWVLTAAHCILNLRSREALIVFAAPTSRGGEDKSAVLDMFVNKEFKPDKEGSGTNDVGLLQLKKCFITSPTVNIAYLPLQDALPLGKATVLGWNSRNIHDDLLMSEMPILSYRECSTIMDGYARLNREENILATTDVCVSAEVHEDSLTKAAPLIPDQIDSGGPLIQYKDGNPIVIGISTWGYGRAEGGSSSTSTSTPALTWSRLTSWFARPWFKKPNVPSVYTRVSSSVDWIKEIAHLE